MHVSIEMDVSSNEDSDISCEQAQSCSYCSKEKILVKGKTYCQECKNNCFRECKRSKRPFHNEKYYTFSESRCNSCHKKYVKEKVKREEKKRKSTEDTSKKIAEDAVEEKRPCVKGKSLRVFGFVPVFWWKTNDNEVHNNQ